MQPISAPPKAGKIAFQYGLIFGIAQAVLASVILLVNTFVNITASQAGISLLLVLLSFLLSLGAYFGAGILAAKGTGKVSTGTFSGMWTGAIYGIICCIVNLVLFFEVNMPRALSALDNNGTLTTSDSFRTGVIVGGVGFTIFGVLFAIGLGAGLGALGGLIGKNISKVQPAPVALAYPVYPAQPYPVQPAAGPYSEQPVANPYSNNPYPPIEQ